MQKYSQWCAITHGHAMMPKDDGLFYKAEDVDERLRAAETALLNAMMGNVNAVAEYLNKYPQPH